MATDELKPTASVLPAAAKAGDDVARRLVRAVRERRWWFMLTAVLTMVVVVVAVRRQRPVYRATGVLTVDVNAPRVLGSDSEVAPLGVQSVGAMRGFYQAQRQILQSRDLAAMVVNRLGLARDERFLGLDQTEKPLTKAQKSEIMASADVVGLMAGRVIVESSDDSGVMRVSIEDNDPDMAKDLVNAVLKAYRDRNIEVKKRINKEASSDLNAIFKRLETEKTGSQDELYKFDRDNDFSENRRAAVNDRILALNRSLREVHTAKLRASQDMAQLKKYRNSKDVFGVSAPSLMRDGLVGELKRRYLELSARRKELAATYLDGHPKVQAIDQQLEQLVGLAGRHVNALYDAAAQQATAAAAEEKDLEAQLEAARQEDGEIRKAKVEHDRLQARNDEDKMFYDKVAKRITETDITRDIGVNNINILDLAVTPKAPIRPNPQSAAMMGLMLALVLGLLVALLVDTLDNTIKTREDIEGILGVPYLGAIPTFEPGDPTEGLPVPEDRIDLYVHFRPNSRAAEAARSVRTNLLFMRPDQPARTLLVTSASPREGKSSTSTTLAITLAASTGKAIIIDTDLRKPRLHKLFGFAGGEGGVTSYLLSHQPVEDFVRKTEVPGLDFLPCGPLPPNPAELIHSQRFRELVTELASKYEAVIFDSPPAGVVTDPLVLASLVDGVVLVAHSEATRRDQLKTVIDGMRAVNASILGVVQSRSTTRSIGYAYYYAKGYRRGGQYRYQYRYQREPDQGLDATADGDGGGGGDKDSGSHAA